MPPYDSVRYDPPAPVATVSLKCLDNTASTSDVPLLIDTGADITLLPRSAVERLGVTPSSQYELISFDGTRSVAEGVELDMIFLRKAFRGRYLLTNDAHGVLGRDVLAALKITFDGPVQEWTM
jgi:predicted aspartyl protease